MSVDYSETERIGPILGLFGGILVGFITFGACIRYCLTRRKPNSLAPQETSSTLEDVSV